MPLTDPVINHSAFPVYFAIYDTFFLSLFFISSWLPGMFCDGEVMRNNELTWNSLRGPFKVVSSI